MEDGEGTAEDRRQPAVELADPGPRGHLEYTPSIFQPNADLDSRAFLVGDSSDHGVSRELLADHLLQMSACIDNDASTIFRHGGAEALTGLDVNDCGSTARDGAEHGRGSNEQEEDEAAELQQGSDGAEVVT